MTKDELKGKIQFLIDNYSLMNDYEINPSQDILDRLLELDTLLGELKEYIAIKIDRHSWLSNIIYLSDEDRDLLLNTIENPPEVSEHLKQAAKEYKEKYKTND